jgi:hypothetical protein
MSWLLAFDVGSKLCLYVVTITEWNRLSVPHMLPGSVALSELLQLVKVI